MEQIVEVFSLRTHHLLLREQLVTRLLMQLINNFFQTEMYGCFVVEHAVITSLKPQVCRHRI